MQRISAEQAQIEARLAELDVDNIQRMLRKTKIEDETEQMNIDPPQDSTQAAQPSPAPRPISAKLRALQKYVREFYCYRAIFQCN